MIISFGTHKDKHVGWVIRNDFSYFKWMKAQKMTKRKEYQEMEKYVSILNRIPFQHACYGECKPKNVATRYSIYSNNPNFQYYCDKCNPYVSGANNGKLFIGATIEELAGLIDCNELIKKFTTDKGLKKGMRVRSFDNFFAKYL